MTLEAFAGYRRQLTGDGLLLVHVSNRYLDLEPVVAAAARHGWHHAVRNYSPSIQQQADLNHSASHWIALSPSRRTIDRLVELSEEQWDPLAARPGFVAWTDDYASILPLTKWSR